MVNYLMVDYLIQTVTSILHFIFPKFAYFKALVLIEILACLYLLLSKSIKFYTSFNFAYASHTFNLVE